MEDHSHYFEANRMLWNKRTPVHAASSFYNIEAFKEGASSLNKIELEGLGDVKDKTLLHLQCHFGMDTMSWQRMGAKCVGVDLSDESIKLATALATELNLPVSFIRANIYDLVNPEMIPTFDRHLQKGGFDIGFTSYGTIGWLPDLDKWAAVIAWYLKPGGIFYIADFHPVLWMMDENFEKIRYSYFNKEVICEETSGTYTDGTTTIKSPEYGWNHPFSEIFSALIANGLVIQEFNEYPYSPYNCFKNVEQGVDSMWRIKGMDEKMPMMYSIKAVKQV